MQLEHAVTVRGDVLAVSRDQHRAAGVANEPVQQFEHALGRTMLIATHSQHVASHCDRVLELHNGKLEA